MSLSILRGFRVNEVIHTYIHTLYHGQEPRPETPPASSSTINSPPTTLTKLQQYISKAQKSRDTFVKDSAAASIHTAKLSRRLHFVFRGSLTQAEIGAQTSADLTRALANREHAQIPKPGARFIQAALSPLGMRIALYNRGILQRQRKRGRGGARCLEFRKE